MKYEMKLNAIPFSATKLGRKTIEIRLNDGRRSLLQKGDHIEFRHVETGEVLSVRVIDIRKYSDMESLVRAEDFEKTGGIYVDQTDWIRHIDSYYAKSDQLRYGLLAIEIVLQG